MDARLNPLDSPVAAEAPKHIIAANKALADVT